MAALTHIGMTMTLSERFFSKVEMDPNGGCWLWSGSDNGDGYGQIRTGDKMTGAHRVSYELFKGSLGGLNVLHKCDVRACVNPDHLVLGTQAENITDMLKKGRGGHPKGVKNHAAKTTEEVVRDIRAWCEGWGMNKKLAEEYGLSSSTVSAIRHRKKWAHVQ